jgi:hypothetical protein
VILLSRVHPLVDFTPLQSPSAFVPAHRPRLFTDATGTSHGVRVSLFAASVPGVVAVGFQAHRPSVRGVSHALDGFIRPKPRGFISPRSHVQGSPSRGLFLAHSRTGSSPARLPSRRWRRSTTASCPAAPSPDAPPSGPCSVRESATCASVLPGAPARSPPGLPSSRCSVSKPPPNE